MTRPTHQTVAALTSIADRMLDGMGDHATALQLKAEVDRLLAAATALDRVDADRSQLDTDAAHFKKVADAAKRLDKETTAALNRALVARANGDRDIQARIDAKLNFNPDENAREIRDRFYLLNGKRKVEELQRLVEEGRGPTLAALLKADGFLTGLSDERRAKYEAAFVAKHAAAELAERERLGQVYAAFDTAQRATGDLVKSLVDPVRLAGIERSLNAANAASEAFEQSMQ